MSAENVRPGGAKEQGLPKRARLAKRWQFLAVSDRQKPPDLKFSAPCFLLIGRANGLDFNRLGVTVTKKTAAHAVDRNRIKRIVREFFRQNTAFWPQGYDVLFIARAESALAGRRKLWDDLKRLGRKLAEGKLPEGRGGGAAPEKLPRASAPPSGGFHRSAIVRALSAGPDFLEKICKGLALGLIYMYRCCISPLFPPSCRFRPTCSRYALDALTVHGFWRGSYLTVRRLLKCHPFHPGGYDPVPPR